MLDPQSTIKLNERNGPDPDIMLSSDIASTSRATAEQITLIVEVADTSREYDLGVKRDRYAAAGIGEYWVVDLVSDVVHVFRQPADGGYLESSIVPPGATVRLQAYADVEIAVSQILARTT